MLKIFTLCCAHFVTQQWVNKQVIYYKSMSIRMGSLVLQYHPSHREGGMSHRGCSGMDTCSFPQRSAGALVSLVGGGLGYFHPAVPVSRVPCCFQQGWEWDVPDQLVLQPLAVKAPTIVLCSSAQCSELWLSMEPLALWSVPSYEWMHFQFTVSILLHTVCIYCMCHAVWRVDYFRNYHWLFFTTPFPRFRFSKSFG